MKKAFVLLILTILGVSYAQTCEDGFRAFEHFTGTTCVPDNPQRIVTLHDTNILVTLLELGVVPVGSAGQINDNGMFFRTASQFDTSQVEHIGRYRSPDPEAVAALEPDLIIATKWDDIESFELLAPTVVIDVHEVPLEDAMLQMADLVNETEQALELQAELNARVEAAREQLGEDFAKTTISILQQNEVGWDSFYAKLPGHSVGLIRRALEPTLTPAEDRFWTEREPKSLEALQEHAADVIFYYGWDTDESGNSELFDAFLAEPLVQLLPAAQAGQIFNVVNHDGYGATWGMVTAELENYLDALTQPDLNRDLVQE
ncbi:MAG: ABC transporter substrate-binding protein [Deinococcota bacterium]